MKRTRRISSDLHDLSMEDDHDPHQEILEWNWHIRARTDEVIADIKQADAKAQFSPNSSSFGITCHQAAVMKATDLLQKAEDHWATDPRHLEKLLRLVNTYGGNDTVAAATLESISRQRTLESEHPFINTTSVTPGAQERLDIALGSIVGMDDLKKQLRDIVKVIEYDVQIAEGETTWPCNMTFSGNSGTGKTSIARKLGEVLFDIKALPGSKGSDVFVMVSVFKI